MSLRIFLRKFIGNFQCLLQGHLTETAHILDGSGSVFQHRMDIGTKVRRIHRGFLPLLSPKTVLQEVGQTALRLSVNLRSRQLKRIAIESCNILPLDLSQLIMIAGNYPVIFFLNTQFNCRIPLMESRQIRTGLKSIGHSRTILSFNMFDAIIRAFGAGLMHGMCTLLVGVGIQFVRKKQKLFVVGTFAMLSTAITYHGIYNMLVQSDFHVIGYLLPITTYIPFLVWRLKKIRQKKHNMVSNEK